MNIFCAMLGFQPRDLLMLAKVCTTELYHQLLNTHLFFGERLVTQVTIFISMQAPSFWMILLFYPSLTPDPLHLCFSLPRPHLGTCPAPSVMSNSLKISLDTSFYSYKPLAVISIPNPFLNLLEPTSFSKLSPSHQNFSL